MVPPSGVERILRSVFQRMAPGLVMELSSDEPKVCVMMAGNVKAMSVNRRGDEPDIMQFEEEEENTKLIRGRDLRIGGKDFSNGGFETKEQRKKILSKPQHASKFTFEPGIVYTFTNYDDVFDLSTFSMKIPIIGKVDFPPFGLILPGPIFELTW